MVAERPDEPGLTDRAQTKEALIDHLKKIVDRLYRARTAHTQICDTDIPTHFEEECGGVVKREEEIIFVPHWFHVVLLTNGKRCQDE